MKLTSRALVRTFRSIHHSSGSKNLGKRPSPDDNGKMDSQNCVKQTIEEVEAQTGCPVQIVQDSSIKNMAVLDIARGSVRLHRIRIHPNFGKEADYLTCFQCGLHPSQVRSSARAAS